MTQPFSPAQADASARRLLVVDFDFFFPNPLEAGAADAQTLRLYDWGHAETVLHRETIWPTRAAILAAEGVPLPRCQPTDGVLGPVHPGHRRAAGRRLQRLRRPARLGRRLRGGTAVRLICTRLGRVVDVRHEAATAL